MADQQTPQHTLNLNDKEVFALICALETFVDTRDSEFRNIVQIAEGVFNRLPRVPVTWNDVKS